MSREVHLLADFSAAVEVHDAWHEIREPHITEN